MLSSNVFCYFSRLEALDVQSYLNLECNQKVKTRDINNETSFLQEKTSNQNIIIIQ